MTQNAIKMRANVGPEGKLELTVPIAEGTPVEVLVLSPRTDDYSDLVAAAAADLEFWNNRWDEEDWNNA